MKQFIFVNAIDQRFKLTDLADAIKAAKEEGEDFVELVTENKNTNGEWVEIWTQIINFGEEEYQKVSL